MTWLTFGRVVELQINLAHVCRGAIEFLEHAIWTKGVGQFAGLDDARHIPVLVQQLQRVAARACLVGSKGDRPQGRRGPGRTWPSTKVKPPLMWLKASMSMPVMSNGQLDGVSHTTPVASATCGSLRQSGRQFSGREALLKPITGAAGGAEEDVRAHSGVAPSNRPETVAHADQGEDQGDGDGDEQDAEHARRGRCRTFSQTRRKIN